MKKLFCIAFFLPAFFADSCFVKAQYAFSSSDIISEFKRENSFSKKINSSSSSDVKVQYRYKKKKMRGTKVSLFVPAGQRPFISALKIEKEDILPEAFYLGGIVFPNGKRGPPSI